MNSTCWQVCIFAVYVGICGKLLIKKGCPSSEGWKGKHNVFLEKKLKGRIVFLGISFDILCGQVCMFL